MAKKGKKGKGKKKKTVEDDPNALTEVDKTFYELTIADLNRKLARLRSLTQELEERNELLDREKQTLDEDRADVIAYLKRILQEKVFEINELEERIIGLQEAKRHDAEKYEAKIVDLEKEYKQMHEQLTSENKLLEGKLNSLEEFRSQREELMKKFENQEEQMQTQEKRHTRELYEIERKFIISKDKLKKDMEARLLQLSTEFHDASELRIAATTHKVIRENIAVNNELDSMLVAHQKLYKDYQVIKARDKTLRQEATLHDEEKKKALMKVRVQQKVIERLTDEHRDLMKDLNKFKHLEEEVRESRNATRKWTQKIASLEYKIKLLEQNLHNVKSENVSLKTDSMYLQEENNRLSDVLMEGVSCIKEALTIKSESDVSLRATKRENLLNTLFVLLDKAQEQKVKKPSLETVPSVEATYAVGDLGFVPKPVDIRPSVITKRNMEAQTGSSLENYGGATRLSRKKSQAARSDLELEHEEDMSDDEVEVAEKESVLFFRESIIEEEETDGESKEFDPFADYDKSSEEDLSRRASKSDRQKSVVGKASATGARRATIKKSLGMVIEKKKSIVVRKTNE
ncbi:cilia- and flagella-associated protein 157 [Cylas formicarius]|uniref:cilia- and flagella-associated protein 157 n=1 Tax=Cylas formicarius TaxID=197179 RepID=UPI002958CF88|nr:cilia- and flagella-associated protein 157 [Cylas formicarius]